MQSPAFLCNSQQHGRWICACKAPLHTQEGSRLPGAWCLKTCAKGLMLSVASAPHRQTQSISAELPLPYRAGRAPLAFLCMQRNRVM